MDVVVDDGHGHPELRAGEEGLPGRVPARIERQLDHSEPGAQGLRVDVPAEIWLLGMRLGYFLHELKRLGVELQRKPKSLCDGLVRDVIVAVMYQ